MDWEEHCSSDYGSVRIYLYSCKGADAGEEKENTHDVLVGILADIVYNDFIFKELILYEMSLEE